MKNFKLLIFSLIILLLNCNCSFAAETYSLNLSSGNDYLITTDKAINASSIKNQDIVTIEQFYTLYNEKNSLIIHTEREGSTQFVLFLNSGDYTFNVKVSSRIQNDTSKVIKKGIFEITAIDEPPMDDNDFDIDAPPTEVPVIKTEENTNVNNDNTQQISPAEEKQNTNEENNNTPLINEPSIDQNSENYQLEAD